MNAKKIIAREGMILLWVSVLALVLTLVSVWPALCNHCWDIWFTILVPVYGLYLLVGIVRFVFWAIKTLRAK